MIDRILENMTDLELAEKLRSAIKMFNKYNRALSHRGYITSVDMEHMYSTGLTVGIYKKVPEKTEYI